MIHIGVVGCGYWGPKHIRVCNELRDIVLTSVCDTDEERLQPVISQYPNVKATTDYEEFLKNRLDAVDAG